MAAAIAVAASAVMRPARAVQVCPDPSQCVQVSVGSANGSAGNTVTVGVSFSQGPGDGQDGGVDEVAALAMTLILGAGGGLPPLTLADCSADSNGLPAAVKLAVTLANFNFVVQNFRCVNGHTHCLCPEPGSGITPDSFINVAVFGPKLQGATPPISIPLLPSGQLFTMDLTIAPEATGPIPIHVLNAAGDSQRPQSTAFLSIGDRLQTDQTCTTVAGQVPCSAPNAVSQVAAVDGSIGVLTSTATPTEVVLTPTHTLQPTLTPTEPPSATPTPSVASTPTATTSAVPTETSSPTATSSATATSEPTETETAPPTASLTSTPTSPPTATPAPVCVGDCSQDAIVTVDEILVMVNVALGGDSVTSCPAGDQNSDQLITVDEILTAVSKALNGCA